jgi:hypothetical protein
MDVPPSDRIIRTAAWLYVLPRAAKGILILGIVTLAAFMVFVALTINILYHLGG